jgi:hypothetical protein
MTVLKKIGVRAWRALVSPLRGLSRTDVMRSANSARFNTDEPKKLFGISGQT